MLISKFNTTDIENHIAEFEAKYSFRFPEQFRDFLFKCNGGDTPKTKFNINRVSSDIRGLYGLGKAEKNLNYAIFDSMKEIEDFLADKVIPIGPNVFGDYIVIGTDGERTGKIYFLYHDRPKKYIELAGDFQSFVSKCKSEKISEAATRSIEEREAILITKGNGHVITDSLRASWQAEIDKYSRIHQEELVL